MRFIRVTDQLKFNQLWSERALYTTDNGQLTTDMRASASILSPDGASGHYSIAFNVPRFRFVFVDGHDLDFTDF